jgi:hypothetical protein
VTAVKLAAVPVDVTTSQRVAELHHQLAIVIRAASFAVSRLGTNPAPADVAQAESVLRDALAEISR